MPFIIFLLVVVVGIGAARWLVPGLPWRRFAAVLSPLNIALAVVGLLGLLLHCVAMFGGAWFAALPGMSGVASQITSAGLASVVWFVVPAVVLVFALRNQTPVVVGGIALTLLAVGLTMFIRVPFALHLVAIFAFVAAVTFVFSALVVASPKPTNA